MTAVTRAITQQVFEEKLRPAIGEPFGPVGNFLAMHRAKQPGAAEGERGEHAGFDLGGQRQNALFSDAVVERIVDLHEIRLLALEHCFDCGEVVMEGRRDPDVTAQTLRLPFLESGKRLLRIADVVELQQVDLRGF